MFYFVNNFRILLIVLFIAVLFFGCSNDEKNNQVKEKADVIQTVMNDEQNSENYKIVFIELGSVNCIPCRMMQPIMKKIENEFPNQVKVVFYDVFTQEGQPYGKKYAIRLIPTQIFLDENGEEFHRHEGFYPFEEIKKVFNEKGVK